MKIRLLSDLHLEISAFTPAAVDADVVILAGDIHVHTRGLDWAAEHFPGRPVIYVPGNHEFYHHDLDEAMGQLRMRAGELGIHLLDNDEVVIQGVRFLGAVLWTDYALFGREDRDARQRHASRLMNDHQLIRMAGGRLFQPEDALRRHEQSREYLQSRLAQPFDGPTVVVTHHAPSPRSIPDRYVGDPLSPAFASDLEQLVSCADFWIHGHTHAFRQYRVGKCQVLSNPRGYVTYRKQEYTGFVDPLVIEINCRWGKIMKPSEALAANRAAIRQVVESHRARNARVFGSVLHGTDREDSDLDLLVDVSPGTTLIDLAALEAELEKLLGVDVHLLTPGDLPQNFRAKVLAEAQPV